MAPQMSYLYIYKIESNQMIMYLQNTMKETVTDRILDFKYL